MSFANPAAQAKENANRYVAALLELLGDQDPVEVLGALVPAIEKAVAGYPDDQLRKPEAPGKWSVIEVIRHLADSELVFGYRMRLVLAGDEPAIQGYDQDRWSERMRYRAASLDDTLGLLEALRDDNLRLIRSLSPAEFGRAGIHSERGRETIRRMIELEAAHDLLHLRQVERIQKSLA